MRWIDGITAILSDNSIANFYADGSVELFPPAKKNGWKTSGMIVSKYGSMKCHKFKFKTMKDAAIIFSELEHHI